MAKLEIDLQPEEQSRLEKLAAAEGLTIGEYARQKLLRETNLENAWDVLDQLAGTIDMPPDWSTEHDHYLYGTPKQTAE